MDLSSPNSERHCYISRCPDPPQVVGGDCGPTMERAGQIGFAAPRLLVWLGSPNLTVTEILASDRKVHEDASDGRGVENARVQKGGKSHRRPSS